MKANNSQDRIPLSNVVEMVSKRYGIEKGNVARTSMRIQLREVCTQLNAITANEDIIRRKLLGTKVLDIGCGNGLDSEMTKGILPSHMVRKMEPWLCRALGTLGVQTTGIDQYFPRYTSSKKDGLKPYNDPEWKFIQRDLQQPDAIDTVTFPDNTFDLVNCRSFIGNTIPVLNDPRMQMLARENAAAYEELSSDIYNQAMRVLKPDGIFIWNLETYKKR